MEKAGTIPAFFMPGIWVLGDSGVRIFQQGTIFGRSAPVKDMPVFSG